MDVQVESSSVVCKFGIFYDADNGSNLNNKFFFHDAASSIPFFNDIPLTKEKRLQNIRISIVKGSWKMGYKLCRLFAKVETGVSESRIMDEVSKLNILVQNNVDYESLVQAHSGILLDGKYLSGHKKYILNKYGFNKAILSPLNEDKSSGENIQNIPKKYLSQYRKLAIMDHSTPNESSNDVSIGFASSLFNLQNNPSSKNWTLYALEEVLSELRNLKTEIAQIKQNSMRVNKLETTSGLSSPYSVALISNSNCTASLPIKSISDFLIFEKNEFTETVIKSQIISGLGKPLKRKIRDLFDSLVDRVTLASMFWPSNRIRHVGKAVDGSEKQELPKCFTDLVQEILTQTTPNVSWSEILFDIRQFIRTTSCHTKNGLRKSYKPY